MPDSNKKWNRLFKNFKSSNSPKKQTLEFLVTENSKYPPAQPLKTSQSASTLMNNVAESNESVNRLANPETPFVKTQEECRINHKVPLNAAPKLPSRPQRIGAHQSSQMDYVEYDEDGEEEEAVQHDETESLLRNQSIFLNKDHIVDVHDPQQILQDLDVTAKLARQAINKVLDKHGSIISLSKRAQNLNSVGILFKKQARKVQVKSWAQRNRSTLVYGSWIIGLIVALIILFLICIRLLIAKR